MQKVITIIGTRPEIIRTSRICPKLDKSCNHIIVHTNQNFTANLKDMFYKDLKLRLPDVVFNDTEAGGWNAQSHTTKGLARQLANMFPQIEDLFKKENPDKVFILGDTNSALCSIIAERMGIPVYHMEAGNRSYDKKIPEEVNRHLIDAISSYNLTYTQTSKEALIREGCNSKKVFLCGNPTLEVLTYYQDAIDSSNILVTLGLAPSSEDFGGFSVYALADFHRTENVDDPKRLEEIVKGLNLIADQLNMVVICSIHPRTKSKLDAMTVKPSPHVKFLDAMGYFDFVKLQKFAQVGLTDSGLVCEELNILRVPCVIMRDTTERPETVESGSAMISGVDADRILEATKRMQNIDRHWATPVGWNDMNVSDRVVNYILGERQ